VGAGHRGDIAVDDISLSVGCSRSNQEIPGHPKATVIPPVGKCLRSAFDRSDDSSVARTLGSNQYVLSAIPSHT